MKTKIVYPGHELRNYVQYFWVLEVPLNEKNQTEIRTFVDDSSGIIFHGHNGESTLIKDGKHLPVGLIYGQARLPSLVKVVHSFSAVGVLFHPHAIRSLFGVDAHYLTDRTYSIEEFDKESDLRDIMLNAKSSEEKIKIFCAFLIHRKRSARNIDIMVSGAIEMIKTLQVTTVKELLEYYRISERQFQRRFLTSVGVSLATTCKSPGFKF